MSYGFSIMMFVFAGALLLYAGLAYFTKDAGLIVRAYASKQKGKKYVQQVAKVLAVTAVAPVLAGVIALFGETMAVIGTVVFVAGMTVAIYVGVCLFVNEDEGN